MHHFEGKLQAFCFQVLMGMAALPGPLCWEEGESDALLKEETEPQDNRPKQRLCPRTHAKSLCGRK